MLRCLRYLQIFQGKNPRQIPPIDFNGSEIIEIVILAWNQWCSCRTSKTKKVNFKVDSQALKSFKLDKQHIVIDTPPLDKQHVVIDTPPLDKQHVVIDNTQWLLLNQLFSEWNISNESTTNSYSNEQQWSNSGYSTVCSQLCSTVDMHKKISAICLVTYQTNQHEE